MAKIKEKQDLLLKLVKIEKLVPLKHLLNDEAYSKEFIINYSHRKTGDSVLSYACREGNLNLVKILHEEYGMKLDQCNFEGKRALHEAAQFGQFDVLDYLCCKNVDMNPLKRADWTPLMLACTKTDQKIIQRLIDAGSVLHLENKDGWNAFHISCREGDIAIIRLLHETDNALSKTVSKNGRTPLHTAALHGHDTVVRYLIEKCGYAPDMRDSCGSTPFMDAIRAGYKSTAHVLYQLHGASVEARDVMGRLSIHLAAETGQSNTLMYLIQEHSQSVNQHTDMGKATPLHLACKGGHTEVVEMLCKSGCDIQAVDCKGRTALHIAAGSQQTGCVRLLLQNQATDCKDDSDTYARDMAQKPLVVKLFEQG